MKLTISGTTPSKKNSRINTRSGRSFPSKRYTEWHDNALVELKSQFKGLRITGYPVTVTVVFYNGDLRRHDLDNQITSVLDTLVDAEILEDDNQKYVDSLQLQYGGLDRVNPRCEIFFDE